VRVEKRDRRHGDLFAAAPAPFSRPVAAVPPDHGAAPGPGSGALSPRAPAGSTRSRSRARRARPSRARPSLRPRRLGCSLRALHRPAKAGHGAGPRGAALQGIPAAARHEPPADRVGGAFGLQQRRVGTRARLQRPDQLAPTRHRLPRQRSGAGRDRASGSPGCPSSAMRRCGMRCEPRRARSPSATSSGTRSNMNRLVPAASQRTVAGSTWRPRSSASTTSSSACTRSCRLAAAGGRSERPNGRAGSSG
jgi:hypothetical protein